MKRLSLVTAIASGALLIFCIDAVAQDPVSSLQDIVGARGRDGERILQERGYEFRWADTSSGDSVYSYWTSYTTGQCINVRTENGRYASIVTSPAFDCDQGDPGHVEDTGSPVHRRVTDLIGARAGSGEQELRNRGYNYVKGEELDNGVATYWIEGSTGTCVEVVTSDGLYQDIFEVEWYYCQ